MNEPSAEALALLEADPPVRVLGDEASLPPSAGAAEIRARIPGAGIAGEEELFSALAAELSLPGWFGANWDALLDCLRDLDQGGDAPAAVTLVIDDAEQLLAGVPRLGGLLIETWVIAALWWAQRGVPFRLVLLIEP